MPDPVQTAPAVPAQPVAPAVDPAVADFESDVSAGHMANQEKDKDEFDKAFEEFSAKRSGQSVETVDTKTETPAPATTSAPPASPQQPAATPAAAAPAAKVEDKRPAWFATLPEEAKAEYIRLETETIKAAEKLARQGAQVNAYERKLQEARKALPAKPAGPSPEAKQFAELYPEISAGVEARMSEVRELVESVKAAIDPLAKDRESRVAQANEAAVEAAHAGWKQTVNEPEFKTWFGKQPASIQALAVSDAPEDAVAVLDFFKAAKGIGASATPAAPAAATTTAAQPAAPSLAAKRQQQLDDARGVPSSRPSTESTSNAPGDFEAAFEFYSKQREKKRAQQVA